MSSFSRLVFGLLLEGAQFSSALHTQASGYIRIECKERTHISCFRLPLLAGTRRRGGLETEASTRPETKNARHRAPPHVHARTTMRTTRTVAGSGTGRTGILLLLVCLWVGWLPYCLVRGFALPQGPGRLSRCRRWPLGPLPLPSRFQPFPCMGASLLAASGKVEGTSGEDGRAVGGDTVRERVLKRDAFAFPPAVFLPTCLLAHRRRHANTRSRGRRRGRDRGKEKASAAWSCCSS